MSEPEGTCKHESTNDITVFEDPRRVLQCTWCGEELDGGPKE